MGEHIWSVSLYGEDRESEPDFENYNINDGGETFDEGVALEDSSELSTEKESVAEDREDVEMDESDTLELSSSREVALLKYIMVFKQFFGFRNVHEWLRHS